MTSEKPHFTRHSSLVRPYEFDYERASIHYRDSVFPAGLFVIFNGLMYLWVDRKLVAQFQNRIGPRWFQPIADVIKLLAKEEIIPDNVNAKLFIGLPIFALAGRPF